MSDLNEEYVYIHRDRSGDPIYVGRGRSPTRAVNHAGDDLSERLLEAAHVVQIAGPFGTVKASEEVEAALISAFRTRQACLQS